MTWLGNARLFSRNPSRNDLRPLAQADGAVVFDVAVVQPPKGKVSLLVLGCGPACEGAAFDLGKALSGATPGQKRTIKVPLRCFADAGAKLESVEMPFVVEADAPFAAAFANIRVAAGAAKDADALACR